jgi:hypothetical protein
VVILISWSAPPAKAGAYVFSVKAEEKQSFTHRLRDATWIPAFAGKVKERAGKTQERAGKTKKRMEQDERKNRKDNQKVQK